MIRILHVEDDPVMVLHSKKRFNIFSYTSVESAEEALDLLSREHFDVVILDDRLKGQMSGTEAIVKLREQGNNIPLVACSYSDNREMLNAGANDSINKSLIWSRSYDIDGWIRIFQKIGVAGI